MIAHCTQTLAQCDVGRGIICAVTNGFCLHGKRHIAISDAIARKGFVFLGGLTWLVGMRLIRRRLNLLPDALSVSAFR
jgi:hypothetical protein